MKTLCLSEEKLSELLTEIYSTPCEVFFDEDEEIDMIRCRGVHTSLIEYFQIIGEHFNSIIESFDMMDLGELGCGYVFYIE